jgi:uncharacterized protein
VTTFDVSRLRLRSGGSFEDTVDVQLEPLMFGGQRYIPVPEEVPARLGITRAATGTLMDFGFRARLHGPCQRCLADAVWEQDVKGREYQASESAAPEELQSPYLHEALLDLSAWARDSLALGLPDQLLCRPDCAGLCPVCGKDLNVEPHEHEVDTDDPRWAALEQLRDRL